MKIFIACAITVLILTPMTLFANDDENNLVCFYRENCQGELEYVCASPDELEPQQNVCPPRCDKE